MGERQKYILEQPATEKTARAYIHASRQFFIAHPEVFTIGRYHNDFAANHKLHAEAQTIYDNLNTTARKLIEKGGTVPAVLVDINRELEKLALAFSPRISGSAFYTHRDVIGSGKFEGLRDTTTDVTLSTFTYLRELLVVRKFGPNPYTGKDYDEHLYEEAPIIESAPLAIHDTLYCGFIIPNQSQSLDYGWMRPDITIDEVRALVIEELIKSGDTARAEGIIRGYFEAHQAARQEDSKIHGQIQKSRISLMAETRGGRAVSEGKHPVFNDGRINAGGLNATANQEIAGSHISQQIEENQAWIFRMIAEALKDSNTNKTHLHGGQTGSNPSTFYRFPYERNKIIIPTQG